MPKIAFEISFILDVPYGYSPQDILQRMNRVELGELILNELDQVSSEKIRRPRPAKARNWKVKIQFFRRDANRWETKIMKVKGLHGPLAGIQALQEFENNLDEGISDYFVREII